MDKINWQLNTYLFILSSGTDALNLHMYAIFLSKTSHETGIKFYA